MNQIAAAAFAFAAAVVSPGFAQTGASISSLQLNASEETKPKAAQATGSQNDDVGIEGYTSTAACTPIYSGDVSSIGPIFGDDEKDTVARTVVETDCH